MGEELRWIECAYCERGGRAAQFDLDAEGRVVCRDCQRTRKVRPRFRLHAASGQLVQSYPKPRPPRRS